MRSTARARRRYRQRSSQERAREVREFRRSGLTRDAFARQRGIAHSTLDNWIREARGAKGVTAPLVLSELKVAPSIGAGGIWSVEVVRPDGYTIRLRETMSAEDLARLLRGDRC